MFSTDNDFETEVTFESSANVTFDEKPFHVLLLGDWSGKKLSSSDTVFSNSKPIEIDRDNFDEVLGKFNIKLELDLKNNTDSSVTIDIKEFDDFHPDKIFEQIPCFFYLRNIRRKLLNSETYDHAASEMRSWLDPASAGSAENKDSGNSFPAAEKQISTENLLDDILNQFSTNETRSPSKIDEKSELDIFLGKLVKPFLIHIEEKEQSDLIAVVDRLTGELMIEILHHPEFIALESAWRGLYFLVRRVETNSDLKIFIFDVNKENLSVDLKSVNNLSDSEFYKLILQTVEISSEYDWSVICGNFEFEINIDDIALLMRLSKIVSNADIPFISNFSSRHFEKSLFDHDSLKLELDEVESKLWNSLRNIPESAYAALAAPRMIARMPYGENYEPLENFLFDELYFDEKFHLWMNPVFCCAYLLAQSYQLNGWEMSKNLQTQINDLPFYTSLVDGKTVLNPSLEYVFNQKECTDILDSGLMTFITFQNSDLVRLTRFQSISNDSHTLKGL